MRPYRAIPIGGKDFVYGWYTEAKDYYKEKKHFIILNNSRFYPFVDCDEKVIEPREYSINIIEVIPETVGQQTGLKDKRGKYLDWWEGDVFEVKGRSTLFGIINEQDCFWLRSSDTKERFSCYQVAKWAELPEKLRDSQTIFNQHPKLLEQDDG